MAIIDKNGRIHGKIGPLSYRVLKNGTGIISSMPKRMKQTRLSHNAS